MLRRSPNEVCYESADVYLDCFVAIVDEIRHQTEDIRTALRHVEQSIQLLTQQLKLKVNNESIQSTIEPPMIREANCVLASGDIAALRLTRCLPYKHIAH